VNEEETKAFLRQFAASESDFKAWPPWMQQSAKLAGASFPKTHRETTAEADARQARMTAQDSKKGA
jgi:hypothetical protein